MKFKSKYWCRMFHCAYSLDKESQREYQLDAILNDKESYIDGKYCPTCGHTWAYLLEPLYPK